MGGIILVSTKWLANLDQACSCFPYDFGAQTSILFITKVKILALIKQTYRSPQIMWTIEPGTAIIFLSMQANLFLNTCLFRIHS